MGEVTARRKALKAAGFNPIPIRGKRPPMNGWQKLHGADDTTIERWARSHPGAKSTGILTKKTPALDIDIKDEGAATAVERLVAERCAKRGQVMTRIGNAPKRAIPFRAAKPFKKITINLMARDGSTGQKLEFLGDGQQFVAFGIHEDTRKPYRWTGGKPGKVKRDELPEITGAEAKKLMIDCVDLLVRDYGYKRAQDRPEQSDKRSSATASRDWELLTTNILEGHELHDSTRDLSMKLVKSGMQPGAVVNFMHALMDASDAKHDHRWLGRREDIKRLVAEAQGKTSNKNQPTSQLEYFNDAIAEEKSKRWLIKNVVAMMETSSWIGPPKSAKSAALLDLLLMIALGRDWRDWTIKQQTGVIYFALERGDLVKRRLKGYARREGIADVPFAVVRGIIDLMSADCVDYIVETINEAAKHFGCEVGIICIDTFSKGIAVGGGDENSASDLNLVSANLRRVQELTGVHVAVVHHTGKDESRGARGSSAHLGDVDAMIRFKHEEHGVVAVEVVGANDQPEGPLTRFKLEPITIGRDEDGEIISTHIVDLEEHGRHKTEKALKGKNALALNLLAKAIHEKGAKVKIGEHYHYAVTIDQWKDACKRGVLTEGTDQTFSRVFRRCLDELRERNRIGIDDNYVWLTSYSDRHPEPDNPTPTRNGEPLNVFQLFGFNAKKEFCELLQAVAVRT